jgi:hypothetical protein
MRWTSGWFSMMEFAIFCISIVLPAFGGETIRPRCPLPIGDIRSISRIDRSPSFSSRSRSSG